MVHPFGGELEPPSYTTSPISVNGPVFRAVHRWLARTHRITLRRRFFPATMTTGSRLLREVELLAASRAERRQDLPDVHASTIPCFGHDGEGSHVHTESFCAEGRTRPRNSSTL